MPDGGLAAVWEICVAAKLCVRYSYGQGSCQTRPHDSMPPLLRLLWNESRLFRRRKLLLLSFISGLSNALIIILINAASSSDGGGQDALRVLLQAGMAIAVYVFSQEYLLVETVVQIERILERTRLRVADLVRHSDLRTLEAIGRSRLYAVVNMETITISQNAQGLAAGAQAFVLLTFAAIYLAVVSPVSLLVSFIIVALTGGIYLRYRGPLEAQMNEAAARERLSFDTMTHMLDGFKEAKLHAPRSDDLIAHLREIADTVAEVRIRTQTKSAQLLIFTEVASYFLILANLLVPLFGSSSEEEPAVRTAGAVSLLLAPIGSLFGAAQSYTLANGAARRILDVEKELAPPEPKPEPAPGYAVTALKQFSEITFEAVTFSYPPTSTEGAFTVGPIDLRLRRGETVFVVGGNGSGKSTLLLLLTGLYEPDSGEIRVDGISIAGQPEAYRSLFSTVFVDYHLFRRLYGLEDVPTERVNELLAQMQLAHKTRLVGRDFETYELSTGQKKRLALIVSLLEDRPIYVLDEWAADQDVTYRRYFYEDLLRDLRARGKTVVTVTHDDRWFHVADRVLEMRDGKIVSEWSGGGAHSTS